MADARIIREKLSQIATRAKRFQVELYLLRFLLCGLLAGLVVVSIYKFTPLPFSVGGMIITLGAISLLAGLGWGLRRQVSLFAAAKLTDLRLGLKERIGSAFEVLRRMEENDIFAALVSDAAQYARAVESTKVLPHRWTKETKFLAVTTAVILALFFTPHYRSQRAREAMETAKVIQEEGKKIKESAKKAKVVRQTVLELQAESILRTHRRDNNVTGDNINGYGK